MVNYSNIKLTFFHKCIRRKYFNKQLICLLFTSVPSCTGAECVELLAKGLAAVLGVHVPEQYNLGSMLR